MLEGHDHALIDQEEVIARYTAILANTWGAKTTTEQVLGRPLRRNWEAAMKKKSAPKDVSVQEAPSSSLPTESADDVKTRVVAKDEERRQKLKDANAPGFD